jgi:cysteine desulfuration protein SufE
MVTLVSEEAELVGKYRLIEDRQERLQVLLMRKCELPGLQMEERVPESEVKGCSSRLWIAAELESGALRWRLETESPMVRSLAGFTLNFCQNRSPEEVALWTPSWLQELDLEAVLSSTRRNGLARVHERVRTLAQSFMP